MKYTYSMVLKILFSCSLESLLGYVVKENTNFYVQ